MGTAPLTADQMLAALAKWGIKPRFYKPDWRTHNRGQRGDGWGPVINGFLVHNFASDISDASSLAYLYNGDNARGMPGPLSQFAIDDAGTVWVIGWGRANHGGTGDAGFVDAMAHDRLPLTADYRPAGKGSVDMNARTYGVEMLYGKAPTQAQRDTVVRLAAALMDAHGYAATSVGAHRESTITRSDPVGFQMGPLRAQVAELLKAGPSGARTSSGAAAPKPAPTGGLSMSDVTDILAKLDAVSKQVGDPLQRADGTTLRKDTTWQNNMLEAKFEGLTAAVQALASAQGVDASQIADVVDKAVRDRLAQVRFDVTDTPSS